jgi:hypothetical protein
MNSNGTGSTSQFFCGVCFHALTEHERIGITLRNVATGRRKQITLPECCRASRCRCPRITKKTRDRNRAAWFAKGTQELAAATAPADTDVADQSAHIVEEVTP